MLAYKYFMLEITNYTTHKDLLQEAVNSLPNLDTRLSLNQSSGRFFYDPWKIKPEFKNTVWEKILDSLECDKGEARLIKLAPGEAYPSHADMDDRWHLSICGNCSYLIDLEKNQMFPTNTDGIWYSMDAGIRHTAANFGSTDRIQLVVRKLLPTNKISNPRQVSIRLKTVIEDRRFIFDDIISPWLNRAYKSGIVADFKGSDLQASMILEKTAIDDLLSISSKYFIVTVSSQ
jgi:hypothetical protein